MSEPNPSIDVDPDQLSAQLSMIERVLRACRVESVKAELRKIADHCRHDQLTKIDARRLLKAIYSCDVRRMRANDERRDYIPDARGLDRDADRFG